MTTSQKALLAQLRSSNGHQLLTVLPNYGGRESPDAGSDTSAFSGSDDIAVFYLRGSLQKTRAEVLT